MSAAVHGQKANKKFASNEKVGCLRQPYSYECRFFCHQSNISFVSQKLKDCFVRPLNRRTALLAFLAEDALDFLC